MPAALPRFLLAMTLIAAACGGAPQRPGLMTSFAKNDVSVTQLRAIDYEFASRFSQLVTKCVNEILDETDDEEIQRRALMWRMYASPEARTAAFNQDPLAGLLELWALAGQQDQYFSIGDGYAFLGDANPCVVATSGQLYAEAEDLAMEVVPVNAFPQMQERVQDWVEANPIEGEFYVRPTAQAGLAALVGRDIEGGLKAVGNMEETLRDLNDRLAILSVQLPTEARWQAEFLIRELFDDQVAGPVSSMGRTLDRLARFLDEFEDAIHTQTSRLLAGFSSEREAAFAALEAERNRVFDSFDDQRASLFDSVDEEIDETITRVEEVGIGMIDYFFERLIAVLIGIGVFSVILVLIVIGALRPSPPAPPPPPSSEHTPPQKPTETNDQN